jgi:Domain of unknown function (DUF4203)
LPSLVTALQVAVGVVVLCAGRRLFWLFVGLLGFACGLELAPLFLHGMPRLPALLIAVLAGVAGAVLAYALQETIVAVVGFFTGVYLGLAFAGVFGATAPHAVWLVALGCGLAGAVLLLVLFDWALILLSALFGASFIVAALAVHPPLQGVVVIVLVLLGIATQLGQWRRRR